MSLPTLPVCELRALQGELGRLTASLELRRALIAYSSLARRPRQAHAWGYVQALLWNARQQALRSGALIRGSEAERIVTYRLQDVELRLESARVAVLAGTPSNAVRV